MPINECIYIYLALTSSNGTLFLTGYNLRRVGGLVQHSELGEKGSGFLNGTSEMIYTGPMNRVLRCLGRWNTDRRCSV